MVFAIVVEAVISSEGNKIHGRGLVESVTAVRASLQEPEDGG